MPLNVRRHIRRMRGGAQSHLVEAEDGACYVVKLRNNPQHPRVLINEAVGSVFLRYLRISAPEVALICLTPEFLRGSPELSIQLGSRSTPAAPGWHFGSQYPGDPATTAVYDFLPDALLCGVANLRDFLGALVFDKWVSNADGRQAVFFRRMVKRRSGDTPSPAFLAWMIDQGFAFNGPHWDFPESPVQGLYHRPLVYDAVTGFDDFQPWLDQVVNFPEEVVDEAFRQVPLEWLDGEGDALEELLEKLMKRRRRVPELIEDCRRAKPTLFPNWRRNPVR
jgi:hypothetical protein